MPNPNEIENTGHASNEPDLTDAEKAALDAGKAPEGEAGADGDGAAAESTTEEGAALSATPPEVMPPDDEQAPVVEGAPPAATQEAPAPAAPFAPTFVAAASERDFDKELADINAALKAAKENNGAGTLNDEDYERAFEDLQERKAQLRIDRSLAENSAAMSQQAADQAWAYMQNQFFSDPANAAIRASAGMFAAWEAEMQAVVNEAHVEGRRLTDWQIMHDARDRMIQQGFPLTPAAGTAAAVPVPAPAPAPPATPAPSRKPNMAAVPPGLGTAPSVVDTGARAKAEEFASSNIEDLETKLAGMSEAQRDELLRSTPGAFVD